MFGRHAIHPTKLANGKIEFIKSNFPEFAKCDPYRDWTLIERIKESMIVAGLYTAAGSRSNPNINSAIINLIKRAKGQAVKNHAPTRK